MKRLVALWAAVLTLANQLVQAQTPQDVPRTASEAPSAQHRILTGWGGGKAEDVVPKAAAVGFSELVVHHENTVNFTKFIELGKQHGVDIYAWLFLGDIPAWKNAFLEADPPLQVMSTVEQEALETIKR